MRLVLSCTGTKHFGFAPTCSLRTRWRHHPVAFPLTTLKVALMTSGEQNRREIVSGAVSRNIDSGLNTILMIHSVCNRGIVEEAHLIITNPCVCHLPNIVPLIRNHERARDSLITLLGSTGTQDGIDLMSPELQALTARFP